MTTTRPVEKSVYIKGFTSIRQSLATLGAVSLKCLESAAGVILRAGDFCCCSLVLFVNPSLNSQRADAFVPLLVPVQEPAHKGRMSCRQNNTPETGFQGLRK